MQYYYSIQMHSSTVMTPDGVLWSMLGRFIEGELADPAQAQKSVFSLIYSPVTPHSPDPTLNYRLQYLKDRALTHALLPYQRVGLNNEEFVLLRSIILCHASKVSFHIVAPSPIATSSFSLRRRHIGAISPFAR